VFCNTGINPIFNEVHVTESNRYELHFIDHQLISKSNTERRESGKSTVRSFHFFAINEDDCVSSVCGFDLKNLNMTPLGSSKPGWLI